MDMKALFVLAALSPLVALAHPGHHHGDEDPEAYLQAPQSDTPIDRSILAFQHRLAERGETPQTLERLAWLFIEKARAEQDESILAGAHACSDRLASNWPDYEGGARLEAFLLLQEHRFQEALALAAEAVAANPSPDALLIYGDIALDVGDLETANEAYQRAMDLKPSSDAFLRGAKLNWAMGDYDRAETLAAKALKAIPQRNETAFAWAATELGRIYWNQGDLEEAGRALQLAVATKPDYAAALYLQGRVALAQDDPEQARDYLTKAIKINARPEYQWALAESAQGNAAAELFAGAIPPHGERESALYWATFGVHPDRAVELARAEFAKRQDSFTADALAWALANAGNWSEAAEVMEQALAPGYRDARLHFHAAVIEFHQGDVASAQAHAAAAQALAWQLLPSERARFDKFFPQLTQ